MMRDVGKKRFLLFLILVFMCKFDVVFALSTPAPAYELSTPGGNAVEISADKTRNFVAAGTILYNGCELNIGSWHGADGDPTLLGGNFHDTCMHGIVEKSVSDAVDNSVRIMDVQVANLNQRINQLQQQLQEAMSEKIDDAVTAKLTDPSSTLLSTAVTNKLEQPSGQTTVLGKAVLDAIKVAEDRNAKNQDAQGKPLPMNHYKVLGLKPETLQGHDFITAKLSGQYSCSGVLTDTIYLEMGQHYSNLAAAGLYAALGSHLSIEVDTNNSTQVSDNVPVRSNLSHDCLLLSTSLDTGSIS